MIMTSQRKQHDAELLLAFKTLLHEQNYGSQDQLVQALNLQGFKNISQAKISRLLAKIGAVKMRNAKDQVVYILPDELSIPKSRQAIQSVVVSIKHNNMLIIVKTGIGGAPLISRMLDSMGESAGILGTLAGDDTIFVAPDDVNNLDKVTNNIKLLLNV